MKKRGKYLARPQKGHRARAFVRGLLILLVAAVCGAATVPVLGGMVLHVGNPGRQEFTKTGDFAIRQEFVHALDTNLAAMLGSLLLTTAVIEIPFIANAFGFTPIGWDEYGIAIGLAILVIPVVEIVKAIQRAVRK